MTYRVFITCLKRMINISCNLTVTFQKMLIDALQINF